MLRVVSLAEYTHGNEKQRSHFVRELGDGLHELGFVSVTDHGISRDHIADAYRAARDFFKEPIEHKLRHKIDGSGGNRGYVGFGAEHSKNAKVGDLKEFFHVGRDLPQLGPGGRNSFPSPAFETVTTTLFADLENAARAMLQAIAEYLLLPVNTFTRMIQGGNSILRLIHYPPLRDAFVPGAVRAAEHEDINLITLLCESTASGLEILTRDGRWLPVEAPAGHLIVDTGDMMQLFTKGRMPSTTHRVCNPPVQDLERYSMPFFVHPYPSCPLTPEITAQQFLEKRLRELGLL